MKHELTQEQLADHIVGEAITLATVMAVLAVAIVAVIVYKMFLSDKGGATIPGGWKFSWD